MVQSRISSLSRRKQMAKQYVVVFGNSPSGMLTGIARMLNHEDKWKTSREKGKNLYKQSIALEGFEKFNYQKYKVVNVLNLHNDLERLKNHHRLRVFYNKGLQCAVPDCPCIGTQMVVSISADGGQHVDILTSDFKLMTVDHKIPKSKGGNDCLDNLQPMCYEHNVAKGNELIYL